jgi:hypothetical protein
MVARARGLDVCGQSTVQFSCFLPRNRRSGRRAGIARGRRGRGPGGRRPRIGARVRGTGGEPDGPSGRRGRVRCGAAWRRGTHRHLPFLGGLPFGAGSRCGRHGRTARPSGRAWGRGIRADRGMARGAGVPGWHVPATLADRDQRACASRGMGGRMASVGRGRIGGDTGGAKVHGLFHGPNYVAEARDRQRLKDISLKSGLRVKVVNEIRAAGSAAPRHVQSAPGAAARLAGGPAAFRSPPHPGPALRPAGRRRHHRIRISGHPGGGP